MKGASTSRDSEAQHIDVKSQVALTIIEAMKQQQTPWQKPWNSASMRPMNPTTGNSYRGINRVLLGLSGMPDARWLTYQQAAANGWQVKKGEKGRVIVKVVELTPDEAKAQAAEEGGEKIEKRMVLKRYYVFNASQIDGIPPLPVPEGGQEIESVERAEGIVAALKEKTGLLVVHQGQQACYVPSRDQILMPRKEAFHSTYDYYATLMHECGHSTLHEKRLDRRDALGKRFGDEAYSLEELRAEISSAILAAETGIAPGPEHIANHAAYLNSWIKSIQKDPMVIFSAAKDAQKMADYLLELEKQYRLSNRPDIKEWVREYDQAASL